MSLDEVDRLIAVVSEDLRTGWERKNLQEGSLLKRREAMASALGELKKNSELGVRIQVAALGLTMCLLLALTIQWGSISLQPRVAQCGLLFFLITSIFWLWCINRQNRLLMEEINEYEKDFGSFKTCIYNIMSVGAGIAFFGPLSDSLIGQHLSIAAYKIFESKKAFEILCHSNPSSDWHSVVQAGHSVGQRELTFEQIYKAATDFGLTFNRREILRNAELEFSRNHFAGVP